MVVLLFGLVHDVGLWWRPGWVGAYNAGMWGFPTAVNRNHMKGELWVGVSPKGWRPMIWAPMKGAPRTVKPRVDNKQHQPTQNPNPSMLSIVYYRSSIFNLFPNLFNYY
ncbi:MAG: hypothetical protein QXH21_08700, partial [Ignisphaera sp.]